MVFADRFLKSLLTEEDLDGGSALASVVEEAAGVSLSLRLKRAAKRRILGRSRGV